MLFWVCIAMFRILQFCFWSVPSAPLVKDENLRKVLRFNALGLFLFPLTQAKSPPIGQFPRAYSLDFLRRKKVQRFTSFFAVSQRFANQVPGYLNLSLYH